MRHYRTSKRFGIITGMDSLDKLKTFLNRVAFDTNLGTSHVSVYLALCYLWLSGQSEECLFISRRKVMALAKIKSSSTYHRVINDLKDLGYIQYYPSYHPVAWEYDQVNFPGHLVKGNASPCRCDRSRMYA
ncbi:MAG: hypothetical protein KF846_08695 [Cyclobacteriaceae bacterium]|nr:hypothetical protein [Cyclobacteriaceae bacterium]